MMIGCGVQPGSAFIISSVAWWGGEGWVVVWCGVVWCCFFRSIGVVLLFVLLYANDIKDSQFLNTV
jgi:hypothetical protein